MSVRQRLRRGCAAIVAIAAGALPAAAQAWTAQLVLSPMPSPFVSDWEVDPTVAELIVTNGTAAATAVTFHYTLTRGGQVVLRGVTDAHTVGGNESKVFNAATTFGGRADWNRELQDMVARTGRLPEGEYQGCVALAGPGGAVLIERECATFTVGYPDPPFLVYPMNGDTVRSQAPMFEWQPVQLPAMADARVGYVLQIAEVNSTTRQAPEVAMSSNILHYVEPNLVETSHQYPVGGLPLVSGRTYAWRVQALDGTGKPIASNQGRSEIWTFVYREPESEAQRTVARVELTASRDTLRFAGDTARFHARAYDVDDVEIVGRIAEWRALDTTVVRVDSTGIATANRLGQTQIVASIDGVADSALSVIASPANLTVRFVAYDAATDKPDLLELITSGSFEAVAPQLMTMLQSGEFRIPLPRLPGIEQALGGSSGAGDSGELDWAAASRDRQPRGGPWAPIPPAPPAGSKPVRARACSDVAFNVRDPYMSLDEKVFVFYIPLNRAQRQDVTNCLGVPNDEGDVTEAERLRGAIFIVSWKHPGVPRVVLAVKGPGFGLTLHGPKVDVRYLVLNITPAIEVGSELLPPNFAGYFGDVSFEAGFGLTYYSRRKCTEVVTPFCRFLSWVNPDNPFISIEAFAGVNASEVSAGSGGAGASVALGFTVSASLPVRKWGVSILGGSLDSTQVGLSFAAQDSLVQGAGAEEGMHHRSMNVAPTLKVWFTGGQGNAWQVDASVAFEVDPDKPQEAVKLVVAAEVPARWKLLVARLGNPMVVFTRKLETEGEVELGLSGSWGLGSWDGSLAEAIGLDAGDAGFEELGRGAVILKWQKPGAAPLARAQSRVEQAKSRWLHDSVSTASPAQAQTLACNLANIQLAAASSMDSASARRFPFEQLLPIRPGLRPLVDQRTVMCITADNLKRIHEATLQRIAVERRALALVDDKAPVTPQPSGPPKCDGTLVFNNTRCFSWSARLSLTTSSLVDLFALAIRFATGAQ